MDFTEILNIAKDNKDRALEQARQKKIAIAKRKAQASAVKTDAVKKFLERKDYEKRVKEANAAQKRDELLSLRAAAKHNRKATAMARRTKDNNFLASSIDSDVDGSTTEMKTPSIPNKTKTQENPKQVQSQRIPQRNYENNGQMRRPEIKQRPQTAGTRPQMEEKSTKQGRINFPSKKPVPALDFNSLMKLAKTKQHEPIVIPEKKTVEEGRLMTQAEKKKFLEEQARKLGISIIVPGEDEKKTSKNTKPETGKKPIPASKPKPEIAKNVNVRDKTPTPALQNKTVLTNGKNSLQKKNPFTNGKNSPAIQNKNPLIVGKNEPAKVPSAKERTLPIPTKGFKQPLPPRPTKPLERKEFPPRDLFPMKKPGPTKINPIRSSNELRRQDLVGPRRSAPPYRPTGYPIKRRYEDDDEEDEMDDFIDDGVGEDNEDYSRHIREIFGYDKRKYAMLDDDGCIESSFSRQMQEESYSSRVGLLEDLEDIRREQEELERKYKTQKKRKR